MSDGLIVAEFDRGGEWVCNGTNIAGAEGQALGTGNQNILDIVNGCNEVFLDALICYIALRASNKYIGLQYLLLRATPGALPIRYDTVSPPT